MKNNKRTQWIVVAIVVIAIGGLAARRINGAPVLHDASQNLQMAINVSHHGVMSLDEKSPYQPSMYREPLPIAVTAIVVRVCDAVFGSTEDRNYFSGARAHFIKLQNCVWLCLLWLTVFAATRMFTESFLAAGVAATISLHRVLETLSVDKDVDGFHLYNVGGLVVGDTVSPPCTPYGVQKLLEHEGIGPVYVAPRPDSKPHGLGQRLLAVLREAVSYLSWRVGMP